MSLPKKLLFAFCFLLFAFASPAHAVVEEGAGNVNLQTEFEETISSGQTSLEESIFESTIGIVKSGNVMLWACQAANCPPEYRFGAINTVGTMIAGIYANPPVSGITYLADVSSRLSPVKPAYAQAAGTGFDALRPVLEIWRGFRNFAYALFVIIFVAIGFAIMFRLQISPQTVITIQSALPRIIVALILVTFSYAIAGFMIDLLYLIMALAILVIGGAAGLNTAELQTQFLQGNFLTALGALNQLVPGGLYLVMPVLGGLIGGALGALGGGTIGGATTGLGAIPASIGFGAIGAIVGLLIIGIIILYVLIKLFIELVKAYVGILLAVILAPLQLLLGALPIGIGFGGWFRGLFVNILIFPAVAAVLLLGRAIGDGMRGGTVWSPPLLGGGNVIGAIIALGILLIVHQIPNAIRQAFKSEFTLGAAVGQPLAGPYGMTRLGLLAQSQQEVLARLAKLPPGSARFRAGSALANAIGRLIYAVR